MRVLIVDDDSIRSNELKALLIKESNLAQEYIVISDNASEAKREMRGTRFNVLILDVILPWGNDSPSAENGLKLLDEITRRESLKTPDRILGITANDSDIYSYQEEFQKYLFTVIVASKRNKQWKSQILNSLKYSFTTTVERDNNNLLCLTVHGIESIGSWQSDLEKMIKREIKDVEFANYKYGIYSFIAFFLPFMRVFAIWLFRKRLQKILSEKPESEFIFFAHSFGTYILIKGLEKCLKEGEAIKIKKIVLAGSVLKSNHDFSLIKDRTGCEIINETGDRDIPLLLSQLVVPFTGMAGRTGFFGFQDSKFVNRYFHGGHSHYFNDKEFMKKYWLPLLSNDVPLEIDQRENSLLNNFIESIIRHIGNFKEIIYSIFFIWIFIDSFL